MGIGARDRLGMVYLLQLREIRGGFYIKCGFTVDLKRRLSAHRSTCPELLVHATWEAPASWEQPMIDCISSICVRRFARETFIVRSMTSAYTRMNQTWEKLHVRDNSGKLALAINKDAK